MTQGFLQAALGRTRSGLRLARSALILARTRTASGRVDIRKLLRAGWQSRPSSDTPPPEPVSGVAETEIGKARAETRAPSAPVGRPLRAVFPPQRLDLSA